MALKEPVLSDILKKRKEKKVVVDGKEYNLSDFDDTKSWTKEKK